MKLGVISQIRNEIDIVETFCNHLDALFDQVYLIDHQSVDGTGQFLKILTSQKPGWKYYFLDVKTKVQTSAASLMLHEAFRDGVDYIFYLDSDEFIQVPSRAALIDSLADLDGSGFAGTLNWKNCIPDMYSIDPLSFHTRFWLPPVESHYEKVIVPRSLYEKFHHKIKMTPGNHCAMDILAGECLPTRKIGTLLHIPIRSLEQAVSKVILTVIAMRGFKQSLPGHAFQYYEILQKIIAGKISDDDLRGYTLGFEAQNLGDTAVSKAALGERGYMLTTLEDLGIARSTTINTRATPIHLGFERKVALALDQLEEDIPLETPLVLQDNVLKIDAASIQQKNQEDMLWQQTRSALTSQLMERDGRIQTLEEQLVKVQIPLKTLDEELAMARSHIQTLEEENKGLSLQNQARLDQVLAYENSTSWKLTRPLRFIKRILNTLRE